MKSMWLRVILGLSLSIVIALTSSIYLKSLKDESTVVVAAVDIPVQSVITTEMLKVISVNSADIDELVPNAIHNPIDLKGALAMVSFRKGDVIVNDTSKVIPAEQITTDGKLINVGNLGRSFYIPPDMKAISISVDSEGSLGYSLKKGDIVDVLFTSSSTDSENSYTATILQGIEIFEVEMVGEKDRANRITGQNIMLLVNSQAAQDLAFAKRKGKIDLILNSYQGRIDNLKSQKTTNLHKFNLQGSGIK